MPPQIGVKRLKPAEHPRRNIAMAYDWQGENDDVLAIVFVGADGELLQRLFDWLCAGGRGLADGYHIEWQHPPYQRQGYCYHRLAVLLDGYHAKFASPADVMLLCQSWLSRSKEVNGGHVDVYALDDLLNLRGRDEEKIIDLKK